MGFFSRSSSDRSDEGPGAQAPVEAPPIDPSSVDLATARSVTRALCYAIGDDDRMWVATAQLMDASGMPDRERPHVSMSVYMTEGPDSLTKLWRWLVAAAKRSNEVGEHDVAAMAYWWGMHWIHAVEPTLGGNADVLLGFGPAPQGTHAALVDEAKIALSTMPDDFVVATTSEPATIQAGALARIVDEQIEADGDIPPDAAIRRFMERAAASRKGEVLNTKQDPTR